MVHRQRTTLLGYLAGAAITAAATLAAQVAKPYLSPANLIMVYLIGVVIVAIRFGRGASVLASFLSVAAFDFFCVHPYLSFAVSDTQYLLTFAMMLTVAVLISTLTTQVREHAEAADQASSQMETERLRSTLLSSVSHDLRTPLATITGASSSLLQEAAESNPGTRHELLEVIYEESERMNRLVGNLLEMTRVESGNILVNKEWQAIEEVIGTALARVEAKLAGARIEVLLPDELLLVPLDAVLIEQVLTNLLDNAIKYAGTTASIAVSVSATPTSGAGDTTKGLVTVCVLDTGPGFSPAESDHVFEKFYRGSAAKSSAGVGLGLAICHGIVKAHGGTITAGNRPGGGAQICFTLPLDTVPPEIREET